jgi:2'-5' RNA ligase
MPRTRTFIAIEVDKTVRGQMIALQESLARTGASVKWVEPQNIHLTLLFLGEVDDRELPALCKAVAETCAEISPFSMTVEGVGGFPNLRRPRVLWVGVGDGKQEVTALHDRLERPLLELGCYRREDRQYTPHLTLGRVTSDRPADKLTAALAKKTDWLGGQVAVREVQVMASQLSPQGPEYTVLGRAKLGSGK